MPTTTAEKKVNLFNASLDNTTITGASNEFTVEKLKIQLLEMEDVLFHLNSAVMMPEKPEGDSSSDGTGDNPDDQDTQEKQNKVSGLKTLALAYKHIDFNPDQQILIAGHADTSGQAAYNFTLSEQRAENVLYLLTGEKDKWTELSAKQHRIEDYQQIMKFAASRKKWACDPGTADNKWSDSTEKACREFFSRTDPATSEDLFNKVKASGEKKWPREAWGPVFDLYMEEIYTTLKIKSAELAGKQQSLPFLMTSAEKPYVACGESFPIDSKEKNNYRSQENRRVEILFIDKKDSAVIDCPKIASRTHKKEECPLWDPDFTVKEYIDPNDLYAEVYYLKFVYYNRQLKALKAVPDGLPIKVFRKDFTEIPCSANCESDIYKVKIQFTEDDHNKTPEQIFFSFESARSWIYTPDYPDKPRIIFDIDLQKEKGKSFKDLPFTEQYRCYDLPEKWYSLNYWTRYDGDINNGESFLKVVKEIKTLRPFGSNAMSKDAPLVFSLDDIILLDSYPGTQEIKDQNHTLPPADVALSNTPNKQSRIKILSIDPDTGLMNLYKTEAAASSARIPFLRNHITQDPDILKNARVIFFRDGFYSIERKRTKEENQWIQKGYVIGARAAVRNDFDNHLGIDMRFNEHEFGATGDYELHYFHNLHIENKHPVSYLVIYVSISFMGDTRDKAFAPVPADADVKKFVDEGIYNAISNWNRKRYFFEEATPNDSSAIIRPFYFFDERETFVVTRPAHGFNIDFDERAQHAALFSHVNLKTAQQNAVGGRSKFLALICKDHNGHWGPAYQWSVRNEGPQHYSLFKLNKSSGEDWPDVFTGIPVTEHGDSFGAHTFSHELGHATGQKDEYIKNEYQPDPHQDIKFPAFDQHYIAYSMPANQPSEMYHNGVPRLHHCWYYIHVLNDAIKNVLQFRQLLSGKEFVARLDKGEPWISRYTRYLDATTASTYQKPQRLTDPMKSAAQFQVSAAPVRRLNVSLFDVGRDESSIKYFHPDQDTGTKIEYQGVIVIRPMMAVSFDNHINNQNRCLKIWDLNQAWNEWREHYRLTGGSKDIKNIFIHILPGYSADLTKNERNYILNFSHSNHPGHGTDRIPNNAGTLTIYDDVSASEIVKYMLNSNTNPGSAGVLAFIRDWINTELSEHFTLGNF